MMEREEALAIAKIAYKEIKESIDKWEDLNDSFVSCHWDECITVDRYLFQERELKNDDCIRKDGRCSELGNNGVYCKSCDGKWGK